MSAHLGLHALLHDSRKEHKRYSRTKDPNYYVTIQPIWSHNYCHSDHRVAYNSERVGLSRNIGFLFSRLHGRSILQKKKRSGSKILVKILRRSSQ